MAIVKWIDFPNWTMFNNGDGLCELWELTPGPIGILKGWRQCMHGYMGDGANGAVIYIDRPSVENARSRIIGFPYTDADIQTAITNAIRAWKTALRTYFGTDPQGWPWPSETPQWAGAIFPPYSCTFPDYFVRWEPGDFLARAHVLAKVNNWELISGVCEIGDRGSQPGKTVDDLTKYIYAEFRHLFGVGHAIRVATPHSPEPENIGEFFDDKYWDGKLLYIIRNEYLALHTTAYVDAHDPYC